MPSKDSLWRYTFLLCAYACLAIILVLMRKGPVVSIPLLHRFWAQHSSAELLSGTPKRLRIPSLHVDVPVEAVGLASNGNMAIPSGAFEAGWFQPGTIPGNPGNAVMAGHLDTVLGTPAVFWKLHELEPGDSVFVDMSTGRTVQFAVSGSLLYDAANAPLEKIFGRTTGKQLQLITCNGAWLQSERTYEKRLVVTSVAKDLQESIGTSKRPKQKPKS